MPYIILYRKNEYFCQGCHDASKSCGPTQNKHETTDCIDMFSLGFHFKTNYFLRSLLMSPWIYYIGRETCSPKICPSVFFRKSGSSLQLPNVHHLPWMKGLCRATNMVSCLSMVNISAINLPFSLQMMFIDYINPLQFLVNVGALFCWWNPSPQSPSQLMADKMLESRCEILWAPSSGYEKWPRLV